MTILVKCPICNGIVKLYTKPKYYFHHCNQAIAFSESLIISQLNLQNPKGLEKKNEEKKPKMVKVKILKAGIDYPKKLTFDDVD